ncbi:DUF3943 domain-containing protein [Vibrio ulleungensis]|uniref:DUF3943 domain-containing protein n=1 Tax=Vibrio ulleungensis TaxID=2807619 RepID=A0ABS2HIK3_9VIBR|nr:DUF3943 domain-containing protein [Vibrio ulleungensis]MBM7035927.1 DUF3943 domain-containing protein [Vibrio ulleungensis]
MRSKYLAAALLTTVSTTASAFEDFSLTSDHNNSCLNSISYCSEPLAFNKSTVTADDYLRFDEPDLPIHFTLQSEKDWNYLAEQTYTILGLSIVTVGIMTLLPESITKWDEESRDLSNLGDKWKENVKAGPVWDRDEHFLNYVMHPYFGGVYYTSARHAGFNEFESFLYSAAMSGLFWEYGVEAFAEVPSWQDLFITPMFGAVVGELMLQGEQHILANDGEVWGSSGFGSFTLFFLNPVGHIHYWVTDAWGGDAEGKLMFNQWFDDPNATSFAIDSGASYDPTFIGYQLSLKF